MSESRTPDLKVVGDPVKVSYFAGGLDSPTFMTRRRIELIAYVETESVDLYAQSEEAARELGAELGTILHQHLSAERERASE